MELVSSLRTVQKVAPKIYALSSIQNVVKIVFKHPCLANIAVPCVVV